VFRLGQQGRTTDFMGPGASDINRKPCAASNK
jgi:hypothetical protein